MNPKPISMMPREHGAYAQLGVSLLASLFLVPASPRAWGQALATALVFLASEPLLVLMGRRGEIAQKQGSPAALRRLLLYGILLFPALGLAWIGAALHQAQSLIPAVVFGAGIFGLFLAGREHSAAGELLAAAAFSLSALPVAILGGISTEKALTLALGLTALHALGTTLVRGFLASLMQGKIRVPKILPVLLGLALSVGVLVSPLPWLLALAPVPLTLAAIWVLWRPPSPRDLRTVGWVLTAGSLVGALTILAGLHGFQRF